MPFTVIATITSILLVAGCVTDPGVSKKRGLVQDFSINQTLTGCDTSYLIYSTPDTCTTSCDTGTHIATATELSTIKTTESAKSDKTVYQRIVASAGLCVSDIVDTSRPTNQIDIKNDFCSCINGKSDLISDCASYCASIASTSAPTLHLNAIIGTAIALNTKLGNLANWCSVQLAGDTTSPQCFLNATDGTTTFSNIPVTVSGNTLTANISSLALDKTYIVKIVEGKTGSNAQSKEFQLRRKTQPSDDTSITGALKVTPISQYSCITYGGTVNSSTGAVTRTSYARVFYYFAANETPPPIPPAGGTSVSPVVCHDEQLHPGNDSALYPRLELIPKSFAMWDKTDPRFVNPDASGATTVNMAINKTLTSRVYAEFGQTLTVDIFKLLPYFNRPTTASSSTTTSVSLGYMMVPFLDKNGRATCPTQTEFNSTDAPLYNLLKEYMDSTEGLYIAEKEAEVIQDNGTYKTIYGTMLVTESILKTNGFYLENSIKMKVADSPSSMHTKTIYFYWPVTAGMDPLLQGNRRLFTVRTLDTLQGNIPTGSSTFVKTTDKRLGCVPKS